MGRIVSKPIDGRYRSERVENFKPSRLVEQAALANALHSSMPNQSLTRFSVSTPKKIKNVPSFPGIWQTRVLIEAGYLCLTMRGCVLLQEGEGHTLRKF